MVLAFAVAAPPAHAQLGELTGGLVDAEVQVPGEDRLVEAKVQVGGHALLCTLGCVALETEYDDGSGTPKKRLHRNLQPGLPIGIDVDGTAAPSPLPILDLLGGFDYELTVSITANTGPVPSEDDFTLRIDKTASAPVNLPLRAELIAGDVDDPAVENTTLGYDTLDSTAPASFVIRVKRSSSTAQIEGWDQTQTTTDADLSLTAPGATLAVVSETFNGSFDPMAGGSGFVRPADRSQSRLGFGNEGPLGPVAGATVPTSATLRLFERPEPSPPEGTPDTATAPAGFQAPSTQITLDHNSPKTALGFLTTSPSSPDADGVPTKVITTGSVDELPSRIDVTLTSPDLDEDGKGDSKVDYVASGPAPNAEVTIRETKGSGADERRATRVARLARVPGEVHAGIADTPLSATSSRTQVEWSASSRTDLDVENDVEGPDESGFTAISIKDVPPSIPAMEYISGTNTGRVSYQAVAAGEDDGRAGETRIFNHDRREEQEFEATLPRLPVEIERLEWHTPTDEVTVGYRASGPTPSARVRLRDDDLDDEELPPEADSREIVTAIDGIPSAFDLTIDTSDANRGVEYSASGRVGRVEVVGTSDASFVPEPGRDVVRHLRVAIDDLPLSVCASFPGAGDLSARAGSGGTGDPEATLCDGQGEVGAIDVRLNTPTGDDLPQLPAGSDGLLLRDGVFAPPAGAPRQADGEFVAIGHLTGLQSLGFQQREVNVQAGPITLKQEEADVDLEATGSNPRVVDTAEVKKKVVWENSEDAPEDQRVIEREGIQTVNARMADPPRDIHAEYRDSTARVGAQTAGEVRLTFTSDRVSDPAGAEKALTLEQRLLFDPAETVPVHWETGPGEQFLPAEYPASDLNESLDVSLDPLPESFQICHAEVTNDCTQDVFTDTEFTTSVQSTTQEGEVIQDTRSFDFGPEDANGGSFRMAASTPVTFNYLKEEVAPQQLVIAVAAIPQEDPAPSNCELIEAETGHWDCFETKPGRNITHLDNLHGSELSFQAHSEGSGGFAARFLPPLFSMLTLGLLGGDGHDTKGYLAMHTGWDADCFTSDGDPIDCPFGANGHPTNSHSHRPPPPEKRMSGRLALGVDWRLPSDPHNPNPSPWTDADLRGVIDDLVGFQLGPLFGADHRVFEADPSDAEGSVIGVADIKNWHGHIYCDDDTEFIGEAEEIGGLLCTSGAEGGTLPPG